ncbi:phosphoadenosine phosphosulfate reductase [Celeribacter sp.]|uniref:phosphoadenosine phosphosulfate reductase n=1 Tax=Celeribacter sp. TaxID=1890673 RepID=UPI003A92EAE8
MTTATGSFDTYDDISGLGHHEWCGHLDDLIEELGYFEQLGSSHAAGFVEGDGTLLVTFDTRADAQARGPKGYPTGFAMAQRHGWSSLTIIAHDDDARAPWFRCPSIFAYFDRLVDDGFFDEYDRVVFYGARSCGYAAAAYSVTAPGATVIAVAPQATLNARLASWDTRFAASKGMDFTTRYGFAPHMIDGAEKAVVLYDPRDALDAMHASLFYRPNVSLRPVPYSYGKIVTHLTRTGVIHDLVETAMTGQLTEQAITRALRKRRRDIDRLRALRSTLLKKNKPLLTALLCRETIRDYPNAHRFVKTLKTMQKRLDALGRTMPEPRAAPDPEDKTRTRETT